MPDAESKINAPGPDKMSVVLGEFNAPFVGSTENLEQYEKLVTVASIAWNAALLEEDKHKDFLASSASTFPARDRKFAVSFINALIQRKLDHFPHVNSSLLKREWLTWATPIILRSFHMGAFKTG